MGQHVRDVGYKMWRLYHHGTSNVSSRQSKRYGSGLGGAVQAPSVGDTLRSTCPAGGSSAERPVARPGRRTADLDQRIVWRTRMDPKQATQAQIAQDRDRLIALSHRLHAHPEIG